MTHDDAASLAYPLRPTTGLTPWHIEAIMIRILRRLCGVTVSVRAVGDRRLIEGRAEAVHATRAAMTAAGCVFLGELDPADCQPETACDRWSVPEPEYA